MRAKPLGCWKTASNHADAFLQELQRVLVDEYGAAKVVYATKFTYSAACSQETIDALTSQCDAVVHGIAD